MVHSIYKAKKKNNANTNESFYNKYNIVQRSSRE